MSSSDMFRQCSAQLWRL